VKALKNGEEKNQKLKVRNEGEEKMNWNGGHLNLYGSFTDGFTDGYKINYYFNLVRRWYVNNPSASLNFAPKFLMTLHIFRGPSAILRGQRRIKYATLWNSRSPSVMLSVKLNHRQLTDVFKFVGVAFGDLMAFQVIIFELSVKHWRTNSVGVSVYNWVAFQVIIFELSVKCRRN
jgi:hypothetical protein